MHLREKESERGRESGRCVGSRRDVDYRHPCSHISETVIEDHNMYHTFVKYQASKSKMEKLKK